jgi:hypothetical protein
MFNSVIRPSPFICLNADSNRSDRFSNMVVSFVSVENKKVNISSLYSPERRQK